MFTCCFGSWTNLASSATASAIAASASATASTSVAASSSAASSIAATTAAAIAPTAFGFLGHHLGDILPGELRLGDALAEIDPAHVIDFDHLHRDGVSNADLILDLVDSMIGQFGDVNEPLLGGEDFDEGAEGHEANHLAGVDLPDLNIAGEVFDHLSRLPQRLPIGAGDQHLPGVIDINLGPRLGDNVPDRPYLPVR